MDTFRIYGKKKEIATSYYEVEYMEYRENGELKQIGTEDFSHARLCKEVKSRYIWTWDGMKRNKGGHRWFECCGLIHYTGQTKYVKAFYKDIYKCSVIELR